MEEKILIFGHVLTHFCEENEEHGGIKLHKKLEIKKYCPSSLN
jgi:hypothetical protein